MLAPFLLVMTLPQYKIIGALCFNHCMGAVREFIFLRRPILGIYRYFANVRYGYKSRYYLGVRPVFLAADLAKILALDFELRG